MDTSSIRIHKLIHISINFGFKIRYNHPQTPILLVGTKLDLAGQTEEVRKARQMGKGVVTFRQVSKVSHELVLNYSSTNYFFRRMRLLKDWVCIIMRARVWKTLV